MESPKFEGTLENKEQLKTEVKIFSLDELLELIYKGESLPQDSRFLSEEEGGVFKYFSLRDAMGISRFPSKKFFPVAYEEGKVVGLSELEQDPKNAQNFWIKFVSVDPTYQGKGYASLLLKKIFQFAKENGYTLGPSFYSEQGLEKLKRVIERLSSETGVNLVS
jgi:GNAT superfamily N-acetyltransferase